MITAETPLVGTPPEEVPLADAPLVRVIAQLRFPFIASIESAAFVAGFQEAIRPEYPVLRPEKTQSVVFAEQGPGSMQTATVWRFHHPDAPWRVALAPDFLALETSRYSNRDDFVDRFGKLVSALAKHVNPKLVDRIGVRYIDRITGDELADLPKLVRPEVLGPLLTPLRHHARHSVSESLFDLPDSAGHVLARWGLLAANSTVDPAAIEAIGEQSWILDLDAWQLQAGDLDAGTISTQMRGLAERIYSIFRWVVTDEFLARYGGKS